MSQFKVEVVKVGELERHPQADTLSITTAQGCPLIVKSDSFWAGDNAVYIPIDAMVPVARPEFSFLANKDKPRTHERIKAKKLRGIFSMGILVPVPKKPARFYDNFLGIHREYTIGEDLAGVLGVTKFEEEEEVQETGSHFSRLYRKWKWKLFGKKSGPRGAGNSHGIAAGPFPYYDLESARHYGYLFDENEEVVLTEKVHGQNGRWGWVDGNKWLVASHGSYKDPEGDSNWAHAAQLYNLKEKLSHYPNVVLYGEVFGVTKKGANIQHLTYGAKTTQLRIFDVYNLITQEWLSYDEMVAFVGAIGLDTVPVLYRGPWKGLPAHEALAEGESAIAKHIREGWVARPASERNADHFGRLVLKFVGQGYLLGNKRTEKH